MKALAEMGVVALVLFAIMNLVTVLQRGAELHALLGDL
ncbi:hypothetical protein QE401_002247 [Pseudoroseomonas cervicalis]|nr:hypothetical protein [Pseudoroseomonas cervicalis]